MLLAIDVGNSQTHLGMFRGDELLEHWRFATTRTHTVDELAAVISALLALRDLRFRDVDGAVVSSVVPLLAHEYEELSDRYFSGTLTVVRPGEMKTGIAIRIDNPHELGTDRLMNAVAAYDKTGGAAIVVDFGTSLNYDVVSAEGEYLGGVIAAGVEISIDALSQRTARLPKVDLATPREVIGRNTIACVQSGAVYGFAGQVDGIVGRVREELGEEAPAIATGGLAPAIVPHCEQVDEIDDLLTLRGLKLIWDRNRR
jgi:type III pantothenate kinase